MMRAAYVVDTRRLDGDVAASLPEEKRGVTLFAEGFSAAAKGDRGGVEKAAAAIGGESAGDHHGDSSTYRMGRPSGAAADAVMKKELEALLAGLAKDTPRALELAKEAAAGEDRISFEFGPPGVIKPAHELLGEMLLAAGNPGEARAEFERSLAHAPNRALSLLGLARTAAKSGDRAAAADAYRRLAGVWRHADPDLPDLAEARNSPAPLAAR